MDQTIVVVTTYNTLEYIVHADWTQPEGFFILTKVIGTIPLYNNADVAEVKTAIENALNRDRSGPDETSTYSPITVLSEDIEKGFVGRLTKVA